MTIYNVHNSNGNSYTCSVAQDQFWRDFGGKIQGVITHTEGCGYTYVSAHAQWQKFWRDFGGKYKVFWRDFIVARE